jgi:hypothetical protein
MKKLQIALVNARNKDAPIDPFDWPENQPLAIPEVGDQTKHYPGPYGRVVARSFNYTSDSLIVELRVEY